MFYLYQGNPFLTGKEQSKNVTSTDQYRCIVKLPDGRTCPRVELSYQKMCVHLAVEHGIRRQSQIDKSKTFL